MAIEDPIKLQILQKFPEYAWAYDHPDIGPIIKAAIDPVNGYDANRVLGEIRETDWYKATRPATRTFIEKQNSDPAALEQSIAQAQTRIWDWSRQMGVQIGGDLVKQLAQEQLMWGLTDDQTKDQINTRAFYQQGQTSSDYAGVIGTAMDDIGSMAHQYMVNIDDATKFAWAKAVANNEKKTEDYGSVLAGWAKGRFPTISKEIDAGITPNQYFEQHRRAIAETLELAPDAVNLLDNKYSAVIDTYDATNKTRRPMTYNETLKFARSQTEWRQTRNGQSTAAKMTDDIMKTMGKIA